MKKLIGIFLLLSLSACGAMRHVAVQADASFAQSVFALTDAALAACKSGSFSPVQCNVGGEVNVKAQQALLDVKAVTSALQDTKNSVLPKNLPDLINTVSMLQKLIGDLSPMNPSKSDLTNKASAALNQISILLSAFTGGK